MSAHDRSHNERTRAKVRSEPRAIDPRAPDRLPDASSVISLDSCAASLDAAPVQLDALDHAVARVRTHAAPLQLHQVHTPAPRTAKAQSIAERAIGGEGRPLPHKARIQHAFGRHEVGAIRSFVGGEASAASRALGATGFAMGDAVAFGHDPDLRLAAHEAAHVVQQRAGVSLMGGVGSRGDVYERHADAVADAVVAGRSAEGLLDRFASSGRGAASSRALQKQEGPQGAGRAPNAEAETAAQTEPAQPSPEVMAAGLQQGVVSFQVVRWTVSWPAPLAIQLRTEGRSIIALTLLARRLLVGGASIDSVTAAMRGGLSTGALTRVGGEGATAVEVVYGAADYMRRRLGAEWSPAGLAEVGQARAGQAFQIAAEYALAHWAEIAGMGLLRPNEDAEELRRTLARSIFRAAFLMSRMPPRNIQQAIARVAPNLPTAADFARINPTLFGGEILPIVRAIRGYEAQQAARGQQDAPDLAPDGLPHPFPMSLAGTGRSMVGGVATYTADVRPTDEQFNPRGHTEGVGRRVLEEARTIQRASYRWELIDLNDIVERSTQGAMDAGRRGLATQRQGREVGRFDGVLRQAGNEFRNWATDFNNSWQAAGGTTAERAQAVLRMFGPVPTMPMNRQQMEQQTHVLNMLLGALTVVGTSVRQGLRLAWHAVVDDANENTVPMPQTAGIYGVRCIMTPRRIDGTPSRHPSIAAKVVQLFTSDELAHQSMNPLEAQFEELLRHERDPARRRVLEQALQQLRNAPETPALDVLQRQLDQMREAQRQMTQGGADWTRAQERIAALEQQLGLARGQRDQVAAGGRTVLTPHAAHVDAETGQMTRMRIQMSVGRASPQAPWEVRISDVTVAAMSEMQVGSYANLVDAIDQAFDRVRHGNVYPRGNIRVRFPQQLVDMGLPADRREHTYACEPLGTPLLRAHLQRLAEDAGYLAFLGVPGAGVAAMALGATSALANMSARYRAGRLHFDGETTSDLMNILPIITSRIPLPSLSGRFRLLRQGGRIIVQGVRLAGEVGPALYPLITIPMHLADQIREIEEAIARGELDPGIGRERIAALLASQGANMLMAAHGLAEHASAALEPGVPEVREGAQNTTEGQPREGQPREGQPREGQPREGQPRDGQQQGAGQTGTPPPGQPRTGQPREGQPREGQPREGQPREGQPREGQPREPELTPEQAAAVPRTGGLEPPRFGAPTAEVEAFVARANTRDILQWWWSLGNWATRMRVEAGRLSPAAQAKVHAARMELFREAERRAGVTGTLSGSLGLGSDVDPTFAGPRTHQDVQRYVEAMEAAIRARGLESPGWRDILGLNPYSDAQTARFQINDRVNGQLTPEAQRARSQLLSREGVLIELNHRNRLLNDDPSGRTWREHVEREVQRMINEHPGDPEPAARLRSFFENVEARAATYDTHLVEVARALRPELASISPEAALLWLRGPDGFLTMREARARMLGEAQAALQARINEGAQNAGAGQNPDAAGQNMSVGDRQRIQEATQDVKSLEEEAYQPSAIESVVGDQQQNHQGRLEAGQQPIAMRDMAPEARMNALIDSLNMLEEHVHQVEVMLDAVRERSPSMTPRQLEAAVRDAIKPLAKYLARALIEARELGMPLPGRFRLLSDLSRMLRARQGSAPGEGAQARNPGETPTGGATMSVAEAEAITTDANRLGIIRDGRIHPNELIGEMLGLAPVLRSAVNNRRAIGPELTAATVPDAGSRTRAAAPSEPTSTPGNRRAPGAGLPPARLPNGAANQPATPGLPGTRAPARCTDRAGGPNGNQCR